MFLFWVLVRSTLGRYRVPARTQHSGSRGKRTSSGMSERRRLGRCEGYGACEDAASLRSRPLGRWARKIVVLSAAPAPSNAPIAARPVQRPPSETDASSTAQLRQQGVVESLFALGRPMVAAAYNIHRTRAAQYKPPIPSIFSANSTPVFAGRWDFMSHKPRRDFFFHRARRILFDLSKRMGGAFLRQIAVFPSAPTGRKIRAAGMAELHRPSSLPTGRLFLLQISLQIIHTFPRFPD